LLVPGTRIGSFEVIAPLGAGGMGEVYRARDPRLGREVAIKVLPAERLTDEDRRRRFVQEAQAASKLNHPHIVTIHEIGSSDGIDFIVMEYVPGQTFDHLIPKNGMPVREVLRLAIPIADALAAAHARGIVHRDIKPANVVVTPEGVVKVLDFGLAKLVAVVTDENGELTTATEGPRTLPGAITGTPAYMSPEQATGGKADARSDIFAFGVVLYEMVTGRRPFAGKSAAETRAAVVKNVPTAPRELVPEIPEALERLILRCLRKEPDRRFQHMVDVKVELQELKEESDSQASAPAGAAPAKRRTLRPWIAWATAAVLASAVAMMVWRTRTPAAPLTVTQLSSERWAGSGSFSPDGTQIGYASAGDDGANWDIWLRIVGEAEARRLTTDPAAEGYPAWSPDGTQIAFLRYTGGGMSGSSLYATGAIHVVSPLGGQVRRLSDFPARLQLSWSPDGRWLAAAKAPSGIDPPGGIYLVSVANGALRAVTLPKPPAYDLSPSFSPDGKALAYASCEGGGNPACDVHVLSLDSETQPQGEPRPLTRQLAWMSGLSWTRDGRSIVYASGSGPAGDLWRVSADGTAAPERVALAGKVHSPSIARSRDRLAFVRQVGDADLYALRLGGSPSPLVQSTFPELQPQYSPEGRQIAFVSGWGGHGTDIWLASANGSKVTRLTRGPGRGQGYPGWSPDGQSIVFDSQAEDGRVTVWTIGVDGSGLRQITHGPGDDILPSWSRDGRFIYFATNRTGRHEIWRVPAGGGSEGQVSRDGGRFALESVDGRTLYYRREDGALMARPTAGGEPRAILPCVPIYAYAVAPRGLFHQDCLTTDSPQRTVSYWDAATRQNRAVATLDADWIGGLSVSPDGQSILYGRGSTTSDLMMIENFR
jgi:serine/threonine protein kinase/Tol biopolymer transport system component